MDKEEASVRMKILRNVIILVAVFAVLGAAYYFVGKYEPESEENTTNSSSIEIFKVKKEQITKIEVKNAEDEYAFYKTDGGWVVLGREYVELNQSRVDSLAYSVASINADALIEQSPADLGLYGLSEPAGSITLTLDDGSIRTFYVGDKTPTRTAYYFKTADEDAVYTVYSGSGENFLQKLNNYRVMTITSFEAESVREITIEKAGSTLSIVYNEPTEEEKEKGQGAISEWKLVKPFTRNADNSKVQEKLITPLTGLTGESIVDDNPSDFSKYGIGSTNVTIKTTDSTTKFKVGRKDGVSYLYVEGKSPVYTIAESKLTFLDVNTFDLIEKFASLINIDTVNSIDIYTPKAEGTLSIKRDGDSTLYYADGADAEESAFKSMYQKVIGLTVDGLVTSPAEKADLQGKVVYHLTDGTTVTLEFYPYDSLNYAVYENGENLFFMKKTKLNDMINALTKFKENPREKVDQ